VLVPGAARPARLPGQPVPCSRAGSRPARVHFGALRAVVVAVPRDDRARLDRPECPTCARHRRQRRSRPQPPAVGPRRHGWLEHCDLRAADMSRPAPVPSASTNNHAEPATGRGASGRVVAVHSETRQGFLVAVVFVVAAGVAGITRLGAGWWLPLHLFVVGGLLSAISAATQMLAVTWSAAPAPRPLLAGSQRWALAAGAIALVAG